MKSFAAPQRLLIFLLLALALTCVLSPWLAMGADWAHARWPEWLDERVPFSRVFNRAFMISGFILFIFLWRFLTAGEVKQLFAAGRREASFDLLTGFALALGSMLVLLAVMAVVDVYSFFLRVPFGRALSRIASALLSALFAGVLEEFFFRGLLFKGLLSTGSAVRAYLVANLFYSAIHFVKPGKDYFVEGIQPLAGFAHLARTFTPFLEPFELLPGLVGLFLIGGVLSLAVARTGTLYLAIGLHAGWILAIKSVRVIGDYSREDLGWLFGAVDPKIVSGVATWGGIVLAGVAVYFYSRKRVPR